ncbi:hypothetical protein AA106555_0817 [Neokomagataea thailandica NBRC 106555]|uniref:Cytochrome c-type biogenesis protein H TPR domain-containing protein n=1 Tax=Neokomagataea thailandica NBRC 106555 TaxID=1223520 RepID=A0ABQ0QP70_9PROT|nr:hypothetical protein AA106555_0817 [Neokomagataea thailandica NBRC 106555]
MTPRQAAAILNLQIAAMITASAHNDNSNAVAVIALQEALRLDPALTVARIFLADLFNNDHQASQGLELLNSVADSDPLAVLAAQERINLATRINNSAETRRTLIHALSLKPNDPFFLTQLADTENVSGLYKDAINHYSQALHASSPRKNDVWPLLLARAMAYESADDWPHAREDMMHALELAPQDADVLNFVGYASVEHNENATLAMSSLEKAVHLQPDNTAIQDSYAWGLLKIKGDLKKATDILHQAAEHAPNDPEIAYHLGVAYWYQGRHTEAQDQWNQALDDTPSSHDQVLIENALNHGGPHLAIFEH